MQSDGGSDAMCSSVPTSRRRPEPSTTQRALGLLTRREHSRVELTRKLTSRGVEADDARAVIDKLANAGWQDDARFAELLVRSRANTRYGPMRIRAELGTHALSADIITWAMDGFEGDWAENALELLRRKHPAALGEGERSARRKAAEFLLRRGFSMDQVREALSSPPDH